MFVLQMFKSELNCIYVGSRGLLLSCDKKSDNPVSDFSGLNPAWYSGISRDNEVLHVCPQALASFVEKVLPNLTRPFILLTNNSDWTIPDDVRKEFNILTDSPLLTHWFAQNCVIDHPKVTRIPIGMDYHSMKPSDKPKFAWSQPEMHRWGPKAYPLFQENELIDIRAKNKLYYDREVKAYGNFHFLMSTRYAKNDRTDAYNTIPKDLVYYEPTPCYRNDSWERMAKYAFVVSPHGNGLDCHRTWEALCLGCIPIVKSSGLNPLFEGLPVWIVDYWSDVTKENMIKKIDEFKNKAFQYERCSLVYYQKLFQEKQNGSGRKDS